MQNKNYTNAVHTAVIEVEQSPMNVFNHLIELSKWWPEEFAGDEIKLNAEFVFKTGEGHYSKNKVIEFVPGKKFVWLTTESKRASDNFNWTGTKMIFELTPKGENAELKFTYDGVVFKGESGRLVQVCDMTLKELFYDFIINGKENKILNQVEMKNQNDFSCSITANIGAGEAIKKISKIPEWWGVTFSGNSEKQNDKFIVRMTGDSFFDFTVAELIPGKKVVWLVTDCNMPWYSDKKEWTNTKLIFDFSENDGITALNFTHEGLTPNIECYKDCETGWTHWIVTSLFSYLTTGKGVFRQPSK